MVPRRLHVCEQILEQEGIYGLIQIEDLHIEFIPLDSDIISLENPYLLKSVFMVGRRDNLMCWVYMQYCFAVVSHSILARKFYFCMSFKAMNGIVF